MLPVGVGLLLHYLILPSEDRLCLADCFASSKRRIQCEEMIGMNTLSSRKYIMFTTAQILFFNTWP